MLANKLSYSYFYRNGLSLVLVFFFVVFLLGQVIAGWSTHNDERQSEGREAISVTEYLKSGHFLSSLFENWESEFLQMWMYVLLTVGLRQMGSSESKKLDQKEEVDREPKATPDAPWPVRKGGVWLKIYQKSLSLAFLLLFTLSFAAHSVGSTALYNDEQILEGEPPVSWLQHVASSKFWFESFQNWQSEFLAVLSIVVLSIWLRQKGSPESKPVDAPNAETGK